LEDYRSLDRCDGPISLGHLSDIALCDGTHPALKYVLPVEHITAIWESEEGLPHLSISILRREDMNGSSTLSYVPKRGAATYGDNHDRHQGRSDLLSLSREQCIERALVVAE
jgi:hypothetical protein